ncbi:ParB/RepB/Spo0J family partition protein [Poseidonocella sedimentorum]|uniref:ParB-like nuclease domain-containing protein n=1 Tax=Poseidonocella sedimentorum TaxID=871652 RepID=A0A1I6EN48_9RHOB|nr:ParB N-terminal domain-containing protein [Poseidonocella sedimentorum]SFR19206.1 ParB-like nuclease domain-containing protein [Poseidonocella sedimentorum]
MAKRKRLTPATRPAEAAPESLADTPPADLETKSVFQRYPMGVAPKPRAPIAQVAGASAAQAALEELSAEMSRARDEGRIVQRLALDAITADHLVRDRLALDEAELASLKASLKARGQQTPIEVVDRGGAGYGLISGWRRLQAIKALREETGETRFDKIDALIKPIGSVSESYVAMVEENEIRAALSFYERAHLAHEAARIGVYPDTATAIATLFANAAPAKRSKIGSFVRLHGALGGALRFPEAIPEKLGLALVAACEGQEGFTARLKDALRKTPPETAAEERAALEAALRRSGARSGGRAETSTATPEKGRARREVAPGVTLEARAGRVVLSGAAVTPELVEDLEAWLAGC